MKLSANPESRHYWAAIMGIDRELVCLLDGREIQDVFEADDVENYLVVYVTRDFRLVYDDTTGQPKTKWLYGKVEFKQRDWD